MINVNEYKYYHHDIYKNLLVRYDESEHQTEQYYKNKKWQINNDRFDAVIGIDPFYSTVSEDQVNKIISMIERGWNKAVSGLKGNHEQ